VNRRGFIGVLAAVASAGVLGPVDISADGAERIPRQGLMAYTPMRAGRPRNGFPTAYPDGPTRHFKDGQRITKDEWLDAVGRHGVLTAESARAKGLDPEKARVYLNGEDVTNRNKVLEARDGDYGYIECFARDSNGAAYTGADGLLVRERIYGHVRIQFLNA